MRIVNLQREHSAVFWITRRPQSRDWRATIIVKAHYRLTPDGMAVADTRQAPVASGDSPAEPDEAPRYSSDFVPYKPNGDFLVVGAAHAPGGTPVARFRVSIGLGEWSKTLAVIGDRRWVIGPLGARPGPPTPFVTLPLDYHRAFGGPGDRRNPVGCGTDMRAERPLPNLEQLDQLITQPINSPDPAGFGPIGITWQPRIGKSGSYDENWLRHRWPWFPADFDWAFYNAAPPDQQFPHFRGNETLTFENLHPDRPIYRTQLPGDRARIFVERLEADRTSFEEVIAKLDTIWVDMSAETLTLVWRGVLPVTSPRLRDIATICATLEPLSTPQAAELHVTAFEAARDEAAPPGAGASAKHQERVAALRKPVEAQVAEIRALTASLRQTAAAIQNTAGGGAGRRGRIPYPEDPMAALEATLTTLRSRDPDIGKRLADGMEAADQKLGAALGNAAGNAWTRERVIDALSRRESLASKKLDGLDLAGLDFSGSDLRDASLVKAGLSAARLNQTNLAGADLSNSDLTNASFVKANLARSTFSGARVDGATFVGAKIDHARFGKLDLSGSDFNGASGTAADFTEAVLDEAYFARAVLPRAQFTAARASLADFSRADLRSADFCGAKAPGIIMEGADLTNLRASRGAEFPNGNFANIQALGSIWQQAVLDRADFSRATLSQAQFPEASLKEANFDRARLEAVCFDDASLVGARLSNANLLRASFERADLTHAAVDGSNLYGAGLLDAILDQASFQGSFVARTLLAR